jgi:hypothetical protein
VLLFAFAWESDSAAGNLERGLRFASVLSDSSVNLDVVRCGSAFETHNACDTLMRQESTRLIVFAGDEGAAAVVAMMSADHHVPVLKLTSDARTMTRLSSYVFEFLPSAETQGRILGEFAARYLGLSGAMMLSPRDARGRALSDGFSKGFSVAGGAMESQRWYAADATAIRPDVDAMFADTTRLSHGGTRLSSALSPEERAQLFGDAQGGQVLYAGSADSVLADSSRPREGFFFTLSPDRVDSYAKQLPTLAPKTLLLGNSSWVDLERRETVTEGMYIVLPLIPEAADTSGLMVAYQQSGAAVNEWSLLGLDAGRLVRQIWVGQSHARPDIIRTLSDAPPISGISTRVDFRSGHENVGARIVRYENGALRVVK